MVLWFVLLVAGCDRLSAAREELGSTALRPDGWESLEDEGAATRLYYQFVDERGAVRFVERLDDVPERWRANVGFVKLDVPPPLSPGDAARARAARVSRGDGNAAARVASAGAGGGVVLYSAEWCGACKKAKRHLDRRGVDYQERDVDVPHHAEGLLRLTGRRAVPVLDVGGQVLTGFSARDYDALIDRT
jgi:glutaredoxin